jgi:hypothetical protein
MERNLKIKLPGQVALKKFKINSSTFGELKEELIGKIDFSEKRVIIKETKLTLQDNDAVLPDYDFMLFLQPLKVKSGYSYEQINNAGYHKLRAMCKTVSSKNPSFKKNLKSGGSYGTIKEMKDALLKEFSYRPEEKVLQKGDSAVDIDSVFKDLIGKVIDGELSMLNSTIKHNIKVEIETARDRIKSLSNDYSEDDLEAIEQEYDEVERKLKRENVILPE